ncbi:MAG: flagellar basal-body rod protein FlgF [candidate division Zixibacteria bacterium]
MIKGIYDSASGMLPRILKQEIYANNMANVNTPGFKKDDIFLEVLTDAVNGSSDRPWQTRMVDGIYVDFTQGSHQRTNIDTNLALEGDGFFVVNTDQGTRYTRNGNFSVSPDGILIDGKGNPVQSDSGPMNVLGDQIVIGSDGIVSVDGSTLGTIKVVDFDRPYALKKIEGTYFVPGDDAAVEKPAEEFRIRQGYLEKSNVNIVEVMVDMLSSFRAYEAGQKAIQTQDKTLEKAVNDLGRVM